ncbi:hypothetical protein BZA05DRAFT_444677 [Tricharina praecox]|uniref:uncharacterized protein n=1 Tax=Tricharina praecox TaxID=43433 RepID=UPI00221F6B42|nr:uncharacterized protein BZA05DRAFT_444677 [Tricharina praecox]KAI5852123.1 hypothetical protein BZA05DRAFT_444677 [Tricharina praecox]
MPVEKVYPERILIPRDQDGNLPDRAMVPYFNIQFPDNYPGNGLEYRPYFDTNLGRLYYTPRSTYPTTAVALVPQAPLSPYGLGELHYWPLEADGRPAFPAPIPAAAFGHYHAAGPEHRPAPRPYPVGIIAAPPPLQPQPQPPQQPAPVRRSAPPRPVAIVARRPPATYPGVRWVTHCPEPGTPAPPRPAPQPEVPAHLAWEDMMQRRQIANDAEEDYRRLRHLAVESWAENRYGNQ